MTGTTGEPEILFQAQNGIGYVMLNRPKALNALTHNMCVRLDERLQTWAKDPQIKAVIIEGAGEKSFCAGGDIRVVHESGKGDGVEARRFFADEYIMNARLAHFPKPYIALLDGIVMGGGVGVSVHGSHRIVTERTLFAMPETGIGLIPDVGGSYFMPRLPGELGMYLGLTGARLKAADTLYAAIATHYVPSDKLPALKAALEAADIANAQDVDRVLAKFTADPGAATLPDIRAQVDRIFAADSVEGMVAGLAVDGSEWASKTRDGLLAKSPTSCKLTFRQLREGARLDFNDGMRMEYRIVCHIMKGHDFFEGVRAVLIDKDHAPRWNPARLEDVSDAEIATYFEPLGADELKL